MRIDAGLDTGDMLLKAETEIGPEETAVELSLRLADLGADLLVRTLAEIRSIAPEPQNNAEATYAPILKKEHGLIDWSRCVRDVHNLVRGVQPWPGAYTDFRRQALHIWRTRPALTPVPHTPPAHERRKRLLARCGDGPLELLEVQLEGKKRMGGEAFANGQRISQEGVFTFGY
jgi:methionyl-tRNA formyltransferase